MPTEREALEKCVAVLKAVEWEGCVGRDSERGCPSCGAEWHPPPENYSHSPTCELVAALQAAREALAASDQREHASPAPAPGLVEALGGLLDLGRHGLFDCFETGDAAPREGCACNTCEQIRDASRLLATVEPREAAWRKLREALKAMSVTGAGHRVADVMEAFEEFEAIK